MTVFSLVGGQMLISLLSFVANIQLLFGYEVDVREFVLPQKQGQVSIAC